MLKAAWYSLCPHQRPWTSACLLRILCPGPHPGLWTGGQQRRCAVGMCKGGKEAETTRGLVLALWHCGSPSGGLIIKPGWPGWSGPWPLELFCLDFFLAPLLPSFVTLDQPFQHSVPPFLFCKIGVLIVPALRDCCEN